MKASITIGDCHLQSYDLQRPGRWAESRPGLDDAAATGVLGGNALLGLVEDCCISAIAPHLDEGEASFWSFCSITCVGPAFDRGRIYLLATCVRLESGVIEWAVSASDDVGIVAQALHGRRIEARAARQRAHATRQALLARMNLPSEP